jgi:hypothetical protein
VRRISLAIVCCSLRYVFVNGAKHKGMKKCAQGTSPYTDLIITSPAYPKTAGEVIRLLKEALDTADRKESQKYDQREFAQLIGAPKSTVHDWYYGSRAMSPLQKSSSNCWKIDCVR